MYKMYLVMDKQKNVFPLIRMNAHEKEFKKKDYTLICKINKPWNHFYVSKVNSYISKHY